MQKDRLFDVLVIGSGVAGLSCIQSLRRLGIRRIGLSADGALPSQSALAAGRLCGGQIDNFTRVSQAHGADFAKELWTFGDVAAASATAFAEASGLTVGKGPRIRLITSASELHEAQQAVTELKRAGLEATLRQPGEVPGLGASLSARVLAVQDEGAHAAWVEPAAFMRALGAGLEDVMRLPAAVSLAAARGGGMQACFADGSEATAEMVVVTAHVGTKALIPELDAALVTVADQWSELRLAKPAPELAGLCYSANNTYEWGAFTAQGHMLIGGGRYLRPMAGIEATTAEVMPKIAEHLLKQLRATTSLADGATLGPSRSALDLWPCDELPVIGPMFGEGRVLVACGFMGAGLTLGFLAGDCLAQLIQTGQAPQLPRRLWPERLRSMES